MGKGPNVSWINGLLIARTKGEDVHQGMTWIIVVESRR